MGGGVGVGGGEQTLFQYTPPLRWLLWCPCATVAGCVGCREKRSEKRGSHAEQSGRTICPLTSREEIKRHLLWPSSPDLLCDAPTAPFLKGFWGVLSNLLASWRSWKGRGMDLFVEGLLGELVGCELKRIMGCCVGICFVVELLGQLRAKCTFTIMPNAPYVNQPLPPPRQMDASTDYW